MKEVSRVSPDITYCIRTPALHEQEGLQKRLSADAMQEVSGSWLQLL